MHHYTATIFIALAGFAVCWVIQELKERNKRKAARSKAAQQEAILTRAIEQAFKNASKKRAAQMMQDQQRAAHKAELEAIERDYHNDKAAPLR